MSGSPTSPEAQASPQSARDTDEMPCLGAAYSLYAGNGGWHGHAAIGNDADEQESQPAGHSSAGAYVVLQYAQS